MRRTLLLTVQVALLCVVAVGHAAPIPKDPRPPARIALDRLNGTWKVTSYVIAGRETIGPNSQMFITFKDGTFAWVNQPGNDGKISRIDPTKKPAEIDYVRGGQTYKAIYKFEGDTFIDCLSAPGGERPTEFVSTQENGHYLMIHTRVK